MCYSLPFVTTIIIILGFHSIINLGSLERFETGAVIDPEVFHSTGLVRGRKKKVKILANGVLTKALTIKAHAFSAQAREKITALGGTAEVG